MNGSRKTQQQLLLEIESLGKKLDVVQQCDSEANERLVVLENILKERLRSETLMIEMSVRFVNLPADRIDSEVEDAQRRICRYLDLDRASLWQVDPEEPGALLLTHLYQIPGIPRPVGRMIGSKFFPWATRKVLGGETIAISKLSDLSPEAAQDVETFRLYGTKSNVLVPLSVGQGPVIGMLSFAVTRQERDWSEAVINKFTLIAQVFANALARKQADTERKRMEDQLLDRLMEIEALKQRLESENVYLREEVKHLAEHADIVGQSAPMKKVLGLAEQVAATDATVLILGETGTGKELLARAIHRMSLRNDRPLITVNCAALPPTLIESELFGREKGAYTGAMTRMTGRFEIADGSTLFLDEIGELPRDLQGKLLRVLEEGVFERLGSTTPMHVDVRIIAATNRNLEQEIKEGKFRKDLFYRLNVFPIVIPPLREHPEDIPLLVRAAVTEFQKKMKKEIESIPKNTMQALRAYSWPGNVRELRNLIERAMILSHGKTLHVDIKNHASLEIVAAGNLEDVERKHILVVLEKTGWRVAGQGGAAEVLGLKRSTLQSKMKKLGIRRSSQAMPE